MLGRIYLDYSEAESCMSELKKKMDKVYDHIDRIYDNGNGEKTGVFAQLVIYYDGIEVLYRTFQQETFEKVANILYTKEELEILEKRWESNDD